MELWQNTDIVNVNILRIFVYTSVLYNELIQYDQGTKRFLCLYQCTDVIAFDWMLNREQRTFGFIRDIYGSESSVTKSRLFNFSVETDYFVDCQMRKEERYARPPHVRKLQIENCDLK